MRLRQYLGYLVSLPRMSGLWQAFEIVYGRSPRDDERQVLNRLARSDPRDRYHAFRTVLGRFDHQSSSTPITVRFSPEDIAYIELEGFSLAVDTTDISVSIPLRWGGYEPHLRALYRNWLKPGMTVVDIGANIGLYSMLAAQVVGDSGQVICFEPNSENCRLILLSTRRNGFKNVTLYPMAASDRTGVALFSMHLGSNGGLIPTNESSLLSPNCMVVPTVRMDELVLDPVDLIKIDVEGAEGLVIRGAQNLIERHRPIVTSEFSMEMLPRVSGMPGKEFLSFFQTRGYDIFLVDRKSSDLIRIEDIDSFIANYGPPVRVEDLAFVPH